MHGTYLHEMLLKIFYIQVYIYMMYINLLLLTILTTTKVSNFCPIMYEKTYEKSARFFVRTILASLDIKSLF